jgi:hypothetical protein
VEYSPPEIPDVPEEACDERAFEIARVIPDMLIVLDRSNSMYDDGLWNPVREAIYTVTGAMDFNVWFGLMIFPNAVGARSCSGLSNQCEPASDVSVPVGEGTSVPIRDTLSGMATCGGTPIALTLQAARSYLESLTDDHPRYVLLTTDGAPNCNDSLMPPCRCTSPMGCELNPSNCLDDVRTNGIIDELLAAGIGVYVLSIGTSSWADVLEEMAMRGGTEHAYYAEDPAAMTAAFEEIAGAVVSCEYDIGALEPGADPARVNFYFDGVVVPMDADGTCDSGWAYTDDTHTRIQFCGPYCDMIMSRSVGTISAAWGCRTVII